MRYLESTSTDPAFNLALEQYAFDTLSKNDELFMLWQNCDSVIVGLHQNTAEEINRAYIDQNGIPVVRRLSGGGAVFHDLGNLNYTIITNAQDAGRLDFHQSCRPIVEALAGLGVYAEANGRNDISVGGRKFSGNARYLRYGRLMHHGTILFDTDFERMSEALHVPEDKFVSKGVKSVRARVTNLREHLPVDMTVAEFWAYLRMTLVREQKMSMYALSARDLEAVEAIRRGRYATWEWNYGQSPEYGIKKRRRLPGVGAIRISMQVEDGKITAFTSDGDYFGSRPCDDIAMVLLNTKLEEDALLEALSAVSLEEYYEGLTKDEFIRLILD
ncbi:lipoate-protein ligase A [Sporobacter termitidis DSM 10068]|uniref:lipoate--protein ligase n=1 Tax=Sporobacter termitidis DSM 10068 TaxID=1123282 RepID=A0A1M5YQX0_9FIRM|nr:lipoate--protein ligase [Sporobacter termitidis]SHI14361.1 lipoate-protein ligase A [Sporobacter termitidis DSM 10068]